jgi:hypothetical protein
MAVPAQFRAVMLAGGGSGIALDFNVSIDPNGAQEYEIAAGEPAVEPERGLRGSAGEGRFQIDGTGVTYVVPDDLFDFLTLVRNEELTYVDRGSSRLSFVTSQGIAHRLPRLRGSIARSGPLAVGLRLEGDLPADVGKPVPVSVDLTFPSSKSWIELKWTIDDRESERVGALAIDLDLKVEGMPILVDFGAVGTVYGTLKDDERMTLKAAPSEGWSVDKAVGSGSTSIAQSRRMRPGEPAMSAEGWAHVMDSKRCTVAAVADFGLRTRDELTAGADGGLRVIRKYRDAGQSPKTLTAWFHFVPMPVQVGALTSPQAMASPLVVEWL